VAQALRRRGYVVAVDVRGRGLGSNLRDAARRGIGYVAVVGPDERESGMVLWRDLAGRDERRVTLDGLPFPPGIEDRG
jgi:histidyl-tRNA synthetase